MFVSAKSDTSALRKISSAIGVLRSLTSHGRPHLGPMNTVISLKSSCDRLGKLLLSAILKKGSSIKPLTDVFTNFVATVKKIDCDQRIRVFINLIEQAS